MMIVVAILAVGGVIGVACIGLQIALNRGWRP